MKIGDTVKLKSGGPLMTVSGEPNTGDGYRGQAMECSWFEGDKIHRVWFFEEALVKQYEIEIDL